MHGAALAILWLAGCQHHHRDPAADHSGPSGPFAMNFPPVADAERGEIVPLFHAGQNGPELPPNYQRITPIEVQELAVRNDGGAKLLEAEPEPDAPRKKLLRHHKGDEGPSAREVALEHAADESRNRAAGVALDFYFTLVATEGALQLYRGGEAEIVALLAEANNARAAGLKDRVNPSELETRLANNRAEIHRLEGAAKELNLALRGTLNLVADPCVRFWPDCPHVWEADIPVDQAVQIGLTYRPDLRLLRSLIESDDPQSSNIARQLLAAVNPLAGGGGGAQLLDILGPVLKLLAKCSGLDVPGEEDDEAVSRQLRELLAGRERQATTEIRASVERTKALSRECRVYSDLVKNLASEVEMLVNEEKAGRSVAAKLALARGARRTAEGSMLKSAADYQAALTKLRLQQGLLVREVLDGTKGGQ